jgi:glycosyltransferase involved in cell wall biosynthesis
MKILFVLNTFYCEGNGLSASARRTVAALREAGQEVRVLSGPNEKPGGPQPEYKLKNFYFPFFQPIIEANGYHFASTDKKLVEEAVRWADVVHMEDPFVLEIKTEKIARRLGKPVTGTYHLHPENIFCSLLFGRWKFPNQLLLNALQKLCYDKWDFVQCPTQNVLQRLQNNHCKSELRAISNGIVPDPCIRVPHSENHPYIVACIGRFSAEKDQKTLLKAMKHCAHAREIQLVFAGKGTQACKLKNMAAGLYKSGVLAYEPVFDFLDRDGLRQLAAKADLCIHCATIEVEGLSIMEAMQQGAVPVIASGPITAADQFALDDRSRFPQGDYKELAAKIDWWLDHPQEREAMSPQYIAQMEKYSIQYSAREMIKMFQDAIDRNHPA